MFPSFKWVAEVVVLSITDVVSDENHHGVSDLVPNVAHATELQKAQGQGLFDFSLGGRGFDPGLDYPELSPYRLQIQDTEDVCTQDGVVGPTRPAKVETRA